MSLSYSITAADCSEFDSRTACTVNPFFNKFIYLIQIILVGFVLSAYLQVPVLGIAIIGFAAAFWYFTTEIRKAEAPAAVAVAANIATEEMGDDFDE